MSQDNSNPSQSILRQAFDQVKPEMDALNEDSFATVSADVVASATTAQGVYPEVVALRPVLVQQLGGFNIAHLDNLKTYALALLYAQGEFKVATEPSANLTEMANNAIHSRAILLADVNALIAHGLLPLGAVNDLQGVNGYKNVMADLLTLSSTLRKHASKIADRTSVRADELAAAEDLAAKFSEAVGQREQSPQMIAAATRNRQAAYTLFMRAYEEVRAAVQYVRRHDGDADTIIPSLFANRGARRKATHDTTDKPNTPNPSPSPAVNPPVVTPGGTGGNNGAPVPKTTSDNYGPYV